MYSSPVFPVVSSGTVLTWYHTQVAGTVPDQCHSIAGSGAFVAHALPSVTLVATILFSTSATASFQEC